MLFGKPHLNARKLSGHTSLQGTMRRRLQHFYQHAQLRTVGMRLVVRSVDIDLVIVRRLLRAGARHGQAVELRAVE